ncbi:GNAT family N-acetyltransferase [Marinomonas spartinae]|uniref:GNAT family N-acetyltransferase n=1 Tax=Marinomonas spartinae TaxID=1792290 RepID=UPI0018F1F989|nr:GNAT family N-acetyltransferase [Marinomonas spartinae]MBJ7555017.1 GNAT family N-acetyltransferase [Marinomonas spartinae]
MRQIKEVFEDQADVIAYIIREANRPVAKRFAINQDNCPKHPSFCEGSWVEQDFKRGERYFVCIDNQQPVACVAYDIPTQTNRVRKAYLNRLSVLPEWQHKGIGAQLVERIIEQARADELELISIGVIGKHSELQDWYEQFGFVKGETKQFDHLPFSVTYMACYLASLLDK